RGRSQGQRLREIEGEGRPGRSPERRLPRDLGRHDRGSLRGDREGDPDRAAAGGAEAAQAAAALDGGLMIANNMVTSANELPGYHITRNLGIVRGITVRSRSIVGTIRAGLPSPLHR